KYFFLHIDFGMPVRYKTTTGPDLILSIFHSKLTLFFTLATKDFISFTEYVLNGDIIPSHKTQIGTIGLLFQKD
ncbi:MAG: hypothetical protein WBN69_12970, partial [Eudoraea sp.]